MSCSSTFPGIPDDSDAQAMRDRSDLQDAAQARVTDIRSVFSTLHEVARITAAGQALVTGSQAGIFQCCHHHGLGFQDFGCWTAASSRLPTSTPMTASV